MSPQLVPTLEQIAEAPHLAHGLPRQTLLELSNRALIAHGALLVSLMVTAGETPAETADRLVTGVEFAKLIGRGPNYVYAHQGEWPFVVREPGCKPMFSLAGYRKWLAERDGRGYVSPRAKSARKGVQHGPW